MPRIGMCSFFLGSTGLGTVEGPHSGTAFFMLQDSNSVSAYRLWSKYLLTDKPIQRAIDSTITLLWDHQSKVWDGTDGIVNFSLWHLNAKSLAAFGSECRRQELPRGTSCTTLWEQTYLVLLLSSPKKIMFTLLSRGWLPRNHWKGGMDGRVSMNPAQQGLFLHSQKQGNCSMTIILVFFLPLEYSLYNIHIFIKSLMMWRTLMPTLSLFFGIRYMDLLTQCSAVL